jgi:hypothetical protein
MAAASRILVNGSAHARSVREKRRMRSIDVYKQLREVIGPRMRELRFSRLKSGYLGYTRRVAGREIVLWFQCHRRPWSKYEGSSFCVNICVMREFNQFDPNDWTERLWFLLNRAERREFVKLSNDAIGKFDPAPIVALMKELFPRNRSLPRSIVARLSPFKRIPRKWIEQWHRYYDHEDVRRWGGFVLGCVERLMPSLEARARRVVSNPR